MSKGKPTVDSINARLKAAKMGVAILRRGDRLYLQATLPPKPGKKTATRQIALGVYANEFGLAEAETLAMKLSYELARDEFDWANWLGKEKTENLGSCESWVSKFKKLVFETKLTGDLDRKEKLWAKRYYNSALKWLPEGKLTEEALIIAAKHYKENTRARQLACGVLSQFADFAELEVDLKPYRGNYSVNSVERDVPSDDEIAGAIDGILNPEWQWIAGMMAAYGLRDHECWHTEFKIEHDPVLGEVAIAVVTDGKTYNRTGDRLVRPLPMEWVKRWNLLEVRRPKVNALINDVYGERTSRQFQRYKLPFAPYDLRHAYALRSTVDLELPVSVSSAHLGHSPEVHLRTYNKHITEKQKREAYQRSLRKREKP